MDITTDVFIEVSIEQLMMIKDALQCFKDDLNQEENQMIDYIDNVLRQVAN